MSAATAIGAAAQLIAVGLIARSTGDLAARILSKRKAGTGVSDDNGADFGWPERALLSVVGFLAFCILLMIANVVTTGAVFGLPIVVPIAGIGVVAVARPKLSGVRRASLGRAGLAAAVLALWLAPVVVSGSAARTGDIPWHLGWTEQLLGGSPVPEGPAPAAVAENGYPWGFHAVLATITRLVPGTDALTALVALDVLVVVGIPLGAACLARRVRRSAGWAAAACASLIGGFGWVIARDSGFFTSPSEARYGADLVVASPNAVYGLLPPPLPRELGLISLACLGVLLALERERGAAAAAQNSDADTPTPRRSSLLFGAGACLGVTGLVSVPLFVVGTVWAVAVALFARRLGTIVARVIVPALLIVALWAGPVVANAFAHGGLVNVSPNLGREWPLWTSLGAWGLLLPLAVGGALLSYRDDRSILLALAAGTILVLGVALARGEFDWSLAGNATVLHQGRVWPAAHLLAAGFAGVALMWLWDRMGPKRRAALCGGIVALGAISSVIAAVSVSRAADRGSGGFSYSTAGLQPGSFVHAVAARLDPDDVVAVEGGDGRGESLAFHLFSFSGVRLATYDDPRLTGNDLRVRYRDLARIWNDRINQGGFDPDFIVRPGGGPGLETGRFGGRTWTLTATGE